MPALSKEFLDIQATIECGFTLKHVCDMTRTYSQMHRTDKYSEHSSIIWPVWLNGWVFVYELSGCGSESSCSHLNCNYCFEYVTVNNVTLVLKCVDCNKSYEKEFGEDLAQRFETRCRFCYRDIIKFCLNFFNTWMVAKDLMKYHCKTRRKTFTEIWKCKTPQILTTCLQKE